MIAFARSIVDALHSPKPVTRDSSLAWLPLNREQLDLHVPVVEAYASPECRTALHDLRALLQEAKRDLHLANDIRDIRKAKEQAIDEGDFSRAAQIRDEERQRFKRAVEGMGIDLAELERRAARVIDSARASVRVDVV